MIHTQTFTDLINTTLSRAFTYRTYPGGRRPMYHRWPYQKIRGARPASDLFDDATAKNNALLEALLRKSPCAST